MRCFISSHVYFILRKLTAWQAVMLMQGLTLTMLFRIANATCRRRGSPSWVHNQTQSNLLGDTRHRSAPAGQWQKQDTKWFSHQWNTSELKPRGVWHRSACEIQTSGCQIGTIADTGETAAESLGSMFLMRNTCVHIQKILQYSTDKKFKLLSGKKNY